MRSDVCANVRCAVFTADSLQYPGPLKIRPTKASSMPNDTNDKWQQAGWATYAAIMLFGGGLVGIVNGIWALRYNDRRADLVLAERQLQLWGAVALIGGVLLLTAGIGAFHG